LLCRALPGPTIAPRRFDLTPVDTLTLYSDLLTDPRSGGGGLYGEDALLDFARSIAPAGASQVITELTTLLDSLGNGVTDDTALLALHRSTAADVQPATDT
ncbi:SpoIIE family protein phosphatase, partial [Nocardia farcinica]|uniref:SpoIIE family protein phosphatase n=1 Tax=Nocardia farcinica TaxID=37329 RepID=UPI0024579842